MTEKKPVSGADVSSSYPASDSDLLRRTVRTVVLLVAACVLFVGMLSLLAFTVTARATHPAPEEQRAPATTDHATSGQAAKKPLSI
ncbi:hypothetical protein AKJ09_07955 [Labilithrix luteola]|uniref:Uncharacterized protein n=1 Tax=Labilithrix luteola TaxID=1391654 RepID=A0A0K1Q6M3_9BACT|nr:hypothetical protein [Labilithrix luteola]AKV01292.1 hypothetical protein AKJ09_07955 [Labilithrix luteola]